MQKTTNIGFNKPDGTDYIVDDRLWKTNWDMVDTQLNTMQTSLNGKANQTDLNNMSGDVSTLKTEYTDISSQVADIQSKSKFEKVTFPLPKVPNKIYYNSSEMYPLDILFYVPQTDTMQGICFYDGYVYIGFDMGSGNGSIRKYDMGGNLIKDSGLLSLGHTADLAYRNSNGHIYVVNGGATNPTYVYDVDMRYTTPFILNTINLNSLGNSGLLAIDNDLDHLIVHTAANDTANPTFSICDFTGNVLSSFSIPNQGTPQGLEYYQGQLLFYTDNKITVIDLKGNVITTIPVSKSGESEGIAVGGDYASPFIILGYNAPNRVYALRSADNQAQYHSFHNLGSTSRIDTPNISLSPVMFSFAINTNAGTGQWQTASWVNGFNNNNLVGTITVNAGIGATGSSGSIIINLKHPLKAIAYFDCNCNDLLVSRRQTASINFIDPNQIMLVIRDTSTGNVIDPTTVSGLSTIRVMLVGAVNIND